MKNLIFELVELQPFIQTELGQLNTLTLKEGFCLYLRQILQIIF